MFYCPNTNLNSINFPQIFEHSIKTINPVIQSFLNNSLQVRITTKPISLKLYPEISYRTVPLYTTQFLWIYTNHTRINRIQLNKMRFFRDSVCYILILLELLYGTTPHHHCSINIHFQKLQHLHIDNLIKQTLPFTGFTYNPQEDIPIDYSHTIHKDIYPYIENFNLTASQFVASYDSLIHSSYDPEADSEGTQHTIETLCQYTNFSLVTFLVPDIKPLQQLEQDLKLNVNIT